jgi:NRPS condensation-like uncharacterized protein
MLNHGKFQIFIYHRNLHYSTCALHLLPCALKSNKHHLSQLLMYFANDAVLLPIVLRRNNLAVPKVISSHLMFQRPRLMGLL